MKEIMNLWNEWRAFHGASTESINRFCSHYARTDEEYETLWELLEGEED